MHISRNAQHKSVLTAIHMGMTEYLAMLCSLYKSNIP